MRRRAGAGGATCNFSDSKEKFRRFHTGGLKKLSMLPLSALLALNFRSVPEPPSAASVQCFRGTRASERALGRTHNGSRPRRAGREREWERGGAGHCPPISRLRAGSGSSGGVPGVRRVKLESVASIGSHGINYFKAQAHRTFLGEVKSERL